MKLIQHVRSRIVWSWAGLVDTWRSEYSFRSWVWAKLGSTTLAFWLLDGAELALILALGLLVLAAELFNTAVERTVDLVSLEKSELARLAKDAASAGVMVTAIATGVAWVVVLLG